MGSCAVISGPNENGLNVKFGGRKAGGRGSDVITATIVIFLIMPIKRHVLQPQQKHGPGEGPVRNSIILKAFTKQ